MKGIRGEPCASLPVLAVWLVGCSLWGQTSHQGPAADLSAEVSGSRDVGELVTNPRQ